mgnify:CR=1 FL=1
MTKTYLGINTETGRCCIVQSNNPVDVRYSAESWGGSAPVDYTIEKRKFRLVGEQELLDNPVTITGEDFDMGHTYKWAFTFNAMQQVKESWED